MNENNIVVGKFPGSTTEINQPADQNPFKATKSKLKTINDSDIEDKVIEKEKLEEMILLHETNCGTTVSPTHKRYIKYGILATSNTVSSELELPYNNHHVPQPFRIHLSRLGSILLVWTE
jgi:hypothetical protein